MFYVGQGEESLQFVVFYVGPGEDSFLQFVVFYVGQRG